MAQAAIQYRGAFISLIQDIDSFDVLDRSRIQYVVTEIYKSNSPTIELVLSNQPTQIVDNLLKKYANSESATLIGVYLRIFTDSSKLVKAWLDLDRIKTLLWTVKNEDLNIQTEVASTITQLFLAERNDNSSVETFIEEDCVVEVLDLFNDLYMELVTENAGNEERKDDDEGSSGNVSAIQILLEVQHYVLEKYGRLKHVFTHNVKYLKQNINFLEVDDNTTQYEAIRHLSFFILEEEMDKEVQILLTKSKFMITAVITDHQFAQADILTDKYNKLKEDMLEKLAKLESRHRVLTDRSSGIL